mgnify:FL=1
MTNVQRCEVCRYVGPGFIYVHGHFQCPKCKQVGDGDCCQGEVCEKPPLDYSDLADEDVPN